AHGHSPAPGARGGPCARSGHGRGDPPCGRVHCWGYSQRWRTVPRMQASHKSPVAQRQRPVIEVDVVMRREPVSGPMARWQPWRWVLADVMLHAAPEEAALLEPDEVHEPQAVEPIDAAHAPAGSTHWLHPRFRVELFRDDAEGYFLNLSSPQPCFWVMWRLDEARLLDGEPMAAPLITTLSYHDAGRW